MKWLGIYKVKKMLAVKIWWPPSQAIPNKKNVISLKKYLQSINRCIYVHIWSDSSFSYSKLQCACCQTSLGNRFWGDWRVWWMITINRGNPALRSRAAFWVKYQMSRQETIFFSIIWQQRAWKRRKPGRKFLLLFIDGQVQYNYRYQHH